MLMLFYCLTTFKSNNVWGFVVGFFGFFFLSGFDFGVVCVLFGFGFCFYIGRHNVYVVKFVSGFDHFIKGWK